MKAALSDSLRGWLKMKSASLVMTFRLVSNKVINNLLLIFSLLPTLVSYLS